MNKPFFSVVLPTRNRADLLPFAVRSVLNQTFGDFEFIVSDNFSSDETPAVAQSFGDERIKYFRSEKSLSIGDSCQFALSHAKGEFITFLSDDDAYSKIFLERMSGIINKENADIVSCKMARYYGFENYEYGKNIPRQSLGIHPFSRKLRVFNLKEAVTANFSYFRLTSGANDCRAFIYPQLVNSAYHYTIIKKVEEKLPRLFPVLGIDTYSSPLFLNVAGKFCVIDEPLYLFQEWQGSTTSGEQTIFQKYPEEGKFDFVPLKKLLSLPNYSTNTVLRAKFDWGEDFQPIPLDWTYYFISSYQEIKYLQSEKIDVSEELAEFEQVLSEQDEKLQEKVKAVISNESAVKHFLLAKLKNSFVGSALLRFKHRRIKFLEGFNNIAECAEMIDETFLKKYAAE